DPDNDPLTYSLTDSAGGRFAINASSGVVTVANGALLTASGQTITVQVSDGRGGTSSASFTITVTPPNHPPTLDPLGALTLNEDSPSQTVNLTGISIGAGDTGQTLTLTAASSDPAIVPNPPVAYAPSSPTGPLTV